MMKQEFEKLAGYEVSFEDYSNIIEPMYMAVGLSKQEFVKVIDRKRFALPTKQELVKEMRKVVKVMVEKLGHVTIWEEQKALREICKQYSERFGPKDFYFMDGYECPEGSRGCSFPYEVVFYDSRSYYEERITLDKEYKKRFVA